jgi:hypothetical protein
MTNTETELPDCHFMSCLADLPELVGFFSYSRQDDEDSSGGLSKLRDRIHRELGMRLGRDRHDFRLWQDKAAIPYGTLWRNEIERAVAESAFFIPIVSPRTVRSEHCKFEFEAFLAREKAVGRNNLVFPILYIDVPGLEIEPVWRNDDVLRIIHDRQYADWRDYRRQDVNLPEVAWQIEIYCKTIVEALRQPWTPPVAPIKPEKIEQPEKQLEAAPARVLAPSDANEDTTEPSPTVNFDEKKAREVVPHKKGEDVIDVAGFTEFDNQKTPIQPDQSGAKAFVAPEGATVGEKPAANKRELREINARFNKGEFVVYTGVSLIALGSAGVIITIIFAIQVFYNPNIAPLILVISFIAFNMATAGSGIGIFWKWRHLPALGLAVCVLGTALDIFTAWLLSQHVSTLSVVLFSFNPDFSVAWWCVVQSLSLGAHVPGLVYFWRFKKQA